MNHKLLALEKFIIKIEPEWKALHEVSDHYLPKLSLLYKKALLKLRESINISMLENEPIVLMDERIDWLSFDIACESAYDIIGDIVFDAGEVSAKYLAYYIATNVMKAAKLKPAPEINIITPEILVTGSFNMRNHDTVKWAQQHVAENIKQINRTSKNAIKSIIANALEKGGSPADTAKMIRRHIGLTDKQMLSVWKYRDKLEKEGVSQTEIKRLEDKFIQNKITERAEIIARTETIAAAAGGQQLHWEDQLSKGNLNNIDLQKEWIVTPDDRLCPICAAMKGERTDINGTFEFGGKAPPRHPRCRCSMGIVERKGQTLEEYMNNEKNQDWTEFDKLFG